MFTYEKSALSLLYRPQLRAIRGMLSTQFFMRRGRERGGGILMITFDLFL